MEKTKTRERMIMAKIRSRVQKQHICDAFTHLPKPLFGFSLSKIFKIMGNHTAKNKKPKQNESPSNTPVGYGALNRYLEKWGTFKLSGVFTCTIRTASY